MQNPNRSPRPHTTREKIASGLPKRHADDSETPTSSEFEEFVDGDPIVDDDDAWDPDEWEDE